MRAQKRKRRQRNASILVVIALIVGVIGSFVSSRSDDDSTSTTTTTLAAATPPKAEPVAAGESIKGTTPCPAADGSSKRASSFEKAPPMCIDANKSYTATFDTTEGTVVVDLDTKKTPKTTNNFVVLSRYHYYDGSSIFRTDTGLDIIQGGGPSTQSNSDPGPGYTIEDEATPFTYKEGDLVMANTGQANSSGAQYFFGTGPNISKLDSQGTYLNFGHASQGQDVLKKIIGLNSGSGQLGGAPSKVVLVNKITITEK